MAKKIIRHLDENMTLEEDTYIGGGKALLLVDEEGFPFITVTVSVPGLKPGEVAIKDYSENAGMLKLMIDNHVVHVPHRHVTSGFATIPVCLLVKGDE